MILPIISYGNRILKTRGKEVRADHPGLSQLISEMFETMYSAKGVGLAAQQVNADLRLFIVDATPFLDEDPKTNGFRKVFINPEILDRTGEDVLYEEGCLSYPGIREEISRKSVIRIRFQDESFQWNEETHDGIIARIIQHEYDHIEGIIMTDRISNLRKVLLKRRLKELSQGIVEVSYKMTFPAAVKKLTKV